MNDKIYAVFGGGMQGKAVAFDLGLYGNAKQILIFDKLEHIAQSACDYVNHLLHKSVCHPIELDLSGRRGNATELVELLAMCDACISCLPFHLNYFIAKGCIEAECHFNDLGGNTDVVESELELHDEAFKVGVSIVPDCGLAPGTNNIFAAHLVDKGMKYISALCGGLPLNKDLPLGYKRTFSMEGLFNEYSGHATWLREGEIIEVPALDEKETRSLTVNVGAQSSEVIEMEAAPTSGGTSVASKTFLEKGVQEYTYRTLRYAGTGHFEFFRNLKKLGMFPSSMEQLDKVFDLPRENDTVTLIVEGGKTQHTFGLIMEVQCDGNEHFSAMAQMTGFSAAIVTAMQANGTITAGAQPVELVVPTDLFIEEFKKRFPQLEIQEAK